MRVSQSSSMLRDEYIIPPLPKSPEPPLHPIIFEVSIKNTILIGACRLEETYE